MDIFTVHKQDIRLCCWAAAFVFAFSAVAHPGFLALGSNPAFLCSYSTVHLIHSSFSLHWLSIWCSSTPTSHVEFYLWTHHGSRCYLSCIASTPVFRKVILCSACALKSYVECFKMICTLEFLFRKSGVVFGYLFDF